MMFSASVISHMLFTRFTILELAYVMLVLVHCVIEVFQPLEAHKTSAGEFFSK